jgi:glycogen operon protein
MLLMGDEVRRSQGGNNNAWCQDNPLGWMHWQPNDDDRALRQFVQRLIALRHHLCGLLNPEVPHAEGKQLRLDSPGHLSREWHGIELGQPDWASWSHTLAWSLSDRHHGPLLWCGLNAYVTPMDFQLPTCPAGWLRVIDTSLPADQDLPAQPESWTSPSATVANNSLMLLVAAPLLNGHPL